MKYQSLANNMFISEHAVCLSQAHDKEQQILEEAKQSCCPQVHFEMHFRELEKKLKWLLVAQNRTKDPESMA